MGASSSAPSSAVLPAPPQLLAARRLCLEEPFAFRSPIRVRGCCYFFLDPSGAGREPSGSLGFRPDGRRAVARW